MMRVVASSLHCQQQEDMPWTDTILGNPRDSMFLATAPNIKCWRGSHLQLVLAFLLLTPAFLLVLVPFAVASGDASYVPRAVLYDPHAWHMAAKRKAASLHMAFLHPAPDLAFHTLLLEAAA